MEDLQSASKLLLKALKMRQRYMRMSRQKFPNLVDGYIRGSKGVEAANAGSNKATIEGELFLHSSQGDPYSNYIDHLAFSHNFHATLDPSWLNGLWYVSRKVVLKAKSSSRSWSSNGPSREESKRSFQMLVLVQLAGLPLLSKLILRLPLEQVNSTKRVKLITRN